MQDKYKLYFDKITRYITKNDEKKLDEINKIISNVQNNIHYILTDNNIASKKQTIIYDLDTGIKILIDMINKKIDSKNHLIIGIAGSSASGKTTIVNMMKQKYNTNIAVLTMGDYYHSKRFIEDELKKGNILNWDQLEALNLDLFKQHLIQLKEGQPIEKLIYNMKMSEAMNTEKIISQKLIITEGLFTLKNFKNYYDIKVFINANFYTKAIRRMKRDIYRKEYNPIDVLKYFCSTVEPMYHKYIKNTQQHADIIIVNEYNPNIEKF